MYIKKKGIKIQNVDKGKEKKKMVGFIISL